MNETQVIAPYTDLIALAERLGLRVRMLGGEFVLHRITDDQEWRRCSSLAEFEQAIDEFAIVTIARPLMASKEVPIDTEHHFGSGAEA